MIPRLLFALGALCSLPSCGGESTPGDGGSSCTNVLPDSCPAQVPSYAADIKPLIMRNCLPCHAPGGIAAPARDFTQHSVLHAQRNQVLRAVHACAMPPADAGVAASIEDRAKLLTWVKCGAPDN